MLSAPRHRGSVSGACRPRSPRPAAPSTASATAWATASASLCPSRPRAPSPVMATPPSTSGRPGRSENRWTSKPCPIRRAGRAGPPSTHRRARQQRLGHGQVLGPGELQVARDRRRTVHTVAPRRSSSAASSVASPAVRWAARRVAATKAWGVCTATSPSRSTVDADRPAGCPLQRVGHRQDRDGPVGPAGAHRFDHRGEQRGRGQGAGGVVDHDDRRPRRAPRPGRPAPSRPGWPPATTTVGPDRLDRQGRTPGVAGGRVAGDHQHDPVGDRAGRVHRPGRHRPAGQLEELLGPTEPAAGSARHHDGPDGPRSAQGSASLSRTSAVSSSTPRAKVSSDTRIWRARCSMRFSPADRPLSLSRMERFRTTSATW